MSFKFEDIIVFFMIGIPLFGSLNFLFKLFVLYYQKTKLPSENGNHKNILLLFKVIIILVMLGISIALTVFLFIMCFFPFIFAKISIGWKLAGVILLMCFWGVVSGLALGLGQVVGAGYGSSGKILSFLFSLAKLENKDDTINKK